MGLFWCGSAVPWWSSPYLSMYLLIENSPAGSMGMAHGGSQKCETKSLALDSHLLRYSVPADGDSFQWGLEGNIQVWVWVGKSWNCYWSDWGMEGSPSGGC